jgi:curved DNA-binding protein
MFTQHFDANKDYFAVLGLHNQACEKTIKLTYRRLARRFHPDVSKMPDATLKFQEIAEAYEVLSKHRDAYCRAFGRFNTADSGFQRSNQSSEEKTAQARSDEGFKYHDYQAHSHWKRAPIDGKDRIICYPLTLRYAIRLLQQGHFYIPGLKLKMKFTRDAFQGKTFRLRGKGYQGLFGGQPGDYLVSFNINQESLSWKLQGADLYGDVKVPKSLLVPGSRVQFDSPVGALSLVVPANYNQNEFIKVQNKGLPSDERGLAGHLYARLIAA